MPQERRMPGDVRELWVFGSILTNRFTDDSAVRNPYFREELNEKRQLIYG